MIYFSPYAPAAYAGIGITHPRMGYFASRSAAMGPASPEVVVATFFNFSPALVHRALPAAWSIASPADVLAARRHAVDQSLRHAWGDEVDGPKVAEAADLARTAAQRATQRPQGRPLFAAHAALDWPEEPHLVLWQAQTLLREFRGDAHVSLLLIAGLDGLGALVTHSATGTITPEALRTSRAWTEAEWSDGVERVRADGWLADGPELSLSEDGRRRRKAIEDRTDELSVHAYEAIGEDGCARLQELGATLSAVVVAADLGFPAALAARYTEPES
jgi:hypothetical protein